MKREEGRVDRQSLKRSEPEGGGGDALSYTAPCRTDPKG